MLRILCSLVMKNIILKNPALKLGWSMVAAVFFILLSASPAAAQQNLTPGSFGSFDDYDRILKRVFQDAYAPRTRARVMISSKYGIENMTAIRADTSGYYLIHILPEESVWYSGWSNIPCRDSDGNELPEDSGRNCSNLDFSSIDAIPVSNYETAIDSTLAHKLFTLWEEMLVRSTYQQAPYFSTGGITFQYSTALFAAGNVQAYSRNPEENTNTGRFALISNLMRNAASSDSEAVSDSLISKLKDETARLIGDLHGYGDIPPKRENPHRTLAGCDSTNRHLVENVYCWQAYLSDDETPHLIVANKDGYKGSDEYVFELIDLSDPDEIRRIHILPVLSVHRPFVRDDRFSGWQNYLLQPYDITELPTSTRRYLTHIAGYRNFTLENEGISYGPDSVIIRFDGLFSYRDTRMLVKVEGDPDWFPVSVFI